MALNQGLIGGTQKNWYDDMTKEAPKMEGYTPASASASQWTVAPDQTVEHRVGNIIKQNSPLSQLAESRSLARSNERGLINSNMAIEAGQKAVYDVAVPIATSDANMFGQAARTNAEMSTQASIASAGFANEASRFGAGARNDLTRLALTERGQDTRMGREFDFRSGEADKLAASVASRDQVAIRADTERASALAGTNLDRDKYGATVNAAAAAVLTAANTARDSAGYGAASSAAAALAAATAVRDKFAVEADRTAAAALAAVNTSRDQEAKETAAAAAASLAAATSARDKMAQDAAVSAATALSGTNATAAAAAAAVLDKRAETLAAVNKAAALFSANVNLELADVNRKNQALLNKSYNAVNAQSAYAFALNSIAMSTLDRTAKDTAIANANTVYTKALALISSVDNVADLSSLVDFSGLQKQPVPLVFPQGSQVPQGPPATSSPQPAREPWQQPQKYIERDAAGM